jgi:TolB protein
LVSLALAVGGLALALPAAAQATFPGRNGKIVYGWTGESAYRAGPAATSIRAVDPRSGHVRVLRDCPLLPPGYTDCRVWAPRYSPDGRRIAFPTLESGPTPPDRLPSPSLPGLVTMASGGSEVEEHATETWYWALAWSPAGDRFLVWRQLGTGGLSGPFAVFLASLDGTELNQVTPETAGTVAWAPDWSSTGEIAFTRSRTGSRCYPLCSDIFVTRLGGSPRRLTYRGGYSPSWSPHGTKLAFVRSTGSGRAGIYLVRRDGSGLRRLTRRGGGPAWSPNGRWIAFVRNGDLYVIRANGRDLRRLVDSPYNGLDCPCVGPADWQALPRR